jgi:hypothetical protein
MGIPIEYHLLFLCMTFLLFIITIFLLFIDVTFSKGIAAFILIFFNLIFCMIVSYGFGAIEVQGFNSDGQLVSNIYSDMHPFIYIYWIFGYINIMLMIYCVYIFYKKPWEAYMRGEYEDEEQYRSTGW